MSFDVNSFVGKRVVQGWGEDSAGNLKWLVNQIEDFEISVDGETKTKVDAQGSTIFSITQAKKCEVGFNSSLLDLNIIAEMNGSEKEIASEENKIVTPKRQIIEITSSNRTSIVLAKSVYNSGTTETPVYKLVVATLTPDGSQKKGFKQGTSVSSGIYTYTSGTKTLTFADGDLAEGDKLLVIYDYETSAAVQVVNSADKFPDAAKATFLIEGSDVCDQTKLLYCWCVFPSTKMSVSSTIKFDLEDTLPVKLECAYSYCSDDKELYRIVIADEE